MLVISGSLPKAGSSWFLHLTNDLLVAAGHPDNKEIKAKFDLGFVKYDECNIQEPTLEKIEILTTPPVSEYTFAVKTHHPPSPHVLDLLGKGEIKVTYIYRDPRDTAVSGLEAGRKLRARGVFERFGKIESMQDAIEWSFRQVNNNWQRWSNIEGVLYFKYEDLLRDPLEELTRLAGYLEIDVPEEAIGEIIERHSAASLKKSLPGSPKYHFNKGKTGRFREVMTAEEIETCSRLFADYLEKMGYTDRGSPGENRS